MSRTLTTPRERGVVVRGALFGRINARAFAMECVAANIFSKRCDEWRARGRGGCRRHTSALCLTLYGPVFDIIWGAVYTWGYGLCYM